MTNSTIVRPTREEWLAMLGELVQMCNECVRRKAQSRKDEVSATAPWASGERPKLGLGRL